MYNEIVQTERERERERERRERERAREKLLCMVGQPEVSLIVCILIFWRRIIDKYKLIEQNYVSLIFL